MAEVNAALTALLRSWGVTAAVSKKFIGEQITIESLRYLSDSSLLELFPKKGPRDTFVHHWTLWKEKTAASADKVEEETNDTSDLELSDEEDSGPQPKRPKRDDCEAFLEEILARPNVNDLHKFLKGTVPGLTILGYEHKNSELDHYTRDLLGQEVIYRALQGNYGRSIPRTEFLDLSKSIVDLFPSESQATWYDEVIKKNTTVVQGRLRFKYYAVRRALYKANLISKHTIEKDLDIQKVPAFNDSDLAQLDEVSSLTAHTSWHHIKECWEATRELRLKYMATVSIAEYISKFPLLQHDLGWTLIAQDGIVSHPCLEFIDTFWEDYSEFVLAIIRKTKSYQKFLKSVDKSASTEEEVTAQANSRFLSIVLKLPKALFKVRTLPKSPHASKSDKKCLRPSVQEVQDAFCLNLTDIALLDEKLSQRRDKLARYKFSLQPVPVVIGSPDNIKQCFIVLDEHRWEVESPSAALWGVMKLCFGLNASYPVEARHVYLFLQQTMLSLNLPRDFKGDKGLCSFLAARVKDYERFLKTKTDLLV